MRLRSRGAAATVAVAAAALCGVAAAVLAAALCAMAAALAWGGAPGTVPRFEAVRARYLPSEAVLTDRHGEALATLRIDLEVRRLAWVALGDISPALPAAVIEAEDRRFLVHHGIDWRAFVAGAKATAIDGRRRGASTLTMQVAALLRGERHGGGWWQSARRKVAQIRLARALEADWSKAQILEAYLNLVQFRGDLLGIGAAAQSLAAKSPSGLSVEESRTLAALLPDPNAPAGRVAARACAEQHVQGAACEALRQTALGMLAHAERAAAAPTLAPQLGAALLQRAGGNVASTLDAGIQREAQAALARQLEALRDHNVRDGAVLVVDNDSGDVLAYVGSAGPFSTAAQVDGVRAQRQAGSTLKPFLYELSLERRYLTAASLLDDSPLTLDTGSGVYIPQDYDHDFKGLVSVRTALGSSLNVPAVRTLVLVGVEAFRDRLHALGYAGITHDGAFYGYSLALGSAEVSLWEQAQAYRALARGGRWSPLRVTPAAPGGERRPMAGEASFVVGDILADPVARAATFGLTNQLNTPFWSAAKTGTSKDMRDNWCVGFSRDYTVAVWVGNFEGDPMHDVSGVTGAAPVWHDLMLGLHREAPAPPAPPAGVAAVAIRFTPAVEPPRREWFLAGTATQRVVALEGGSRLARLTSPANGLVIALDPDIPARAQRIVVSAQGAQPGMRMRLNDRPLGPATQRLLWSPTRGAQHLILEDRDGRVLDRLLFTVR